MLQVLRTLFAQAAEGGKTLQRVLPLPAADSCLQFVALDSSVSQQLSVTSEGCFIKPGAMDCRAGGGSCAEGCTSDNAHCLCM